MSNNPNQMPQSSGMSHNPYHQLPTPASSTELRAQPATDFVSPMTLHYVDPPRQPQYANHMQGMMPPMSAHSGVPLSSSSSHPSPRQPAHVWNSAPANIAFNTQPVNEMDFDISPIASPMFGATTDGYGMAGPSSRQSGYPGMHMGGRKRTASPGDIDPYPTRTRKRPAPQQGIASPMNLTPSGVQRRTSRAKSANNTPMLRGSGSRARKGSAATLAVRDELPTDSPSPVDLAMPPPAPPPLMHSTSAGSDPTTPLMMDSSGPGSSDQLTPVTPASIMNMSDLTLRSGLSPDPLAGFLGDPMHNGVVQPALPSNNNPANINNANGLRTRAASTSALTGSGPSTRSKKPASGNYKAILPAGGSPALAMPNMGTGTGLGMGMGGSGTGIKKVTNHKESEQKRRDSLKAAYDNLRTLLPAIPLPTEDGTIAEGGAVLPGALPPRGPPRGPGDGPNRGVSKLQLLRCGNAFIRALKGRVERRDDEIADLRRAVLKLQGMVGESGGTIEEGLEALDLEKDLDAVEGIGGVTGAYLVNAAAVEDEDGDE
jgi:hypothetical protein